MFDIFTIIIFLALAVFIFLQLRSGLAQRTGRERPPYEVTLPSRPAKASPHPAKASQPPGDRWKGIAESGAPVAAGLDEIATADPSFDAKHFITGARTAYETIVTSFAEGDRRQLRSLLSARRITASMPRSPNAKVAARPPRRASFRLTARRLPPPSCAAAAPRSQAASSPSCSPLRATDPGP